MIYEQGELRAVAYKAGKEIGAAIRRTAGPPIALRLASDREKIASGGQDLCYVLVEMVDAAGTVCPLASDMVTFTITGPASIAGMGNGNPLSLQSFADSEHALFHGKAMLVVRSGRAKTGEVHVTAQASGAKPATAKLVVE